VPSLGWPCSHSKNSKTLQGTRLPSCTSEVMQGLFPCVSLLTYISSPWHPAVLSPNSEVLRGYLVCPPLFGTPQATRGKGRSITPSYYQLVYLNHFRSLSLEGFSVWWYLLNHYGRTTRLLFLGGLVYYMIFLC
jgi:hypothetical protein